MAVRNTDVTNLEEIKKNLVLNPTLIVGPCYEDINLHLADFYLANKEELKGIYHLSEAHAATLRQQAVIRYDYKEDQITNVKSSNTTVSVEQGLQKKLLDFESDYAKQEENGLLARLREMPKEWTVVQITREASRTPEEQFKIRLKDSPVEPSNLYITRLPCGDALKEKSPVTMLIKKPEKIHGMPTIFELIKQAKQCLRTKNTKASVIRKEREKGSQYIKEVAEVLYNKVLKEWKCLLMGVLFSDSHKQKVLSCIDNVVDSDKFKSYNMSGRDRQLLYQVVDSCVHLSPAEIHSAVGCLVDCRELGVELIRVYGFVTSMSGRDRQLLYQVVDSCVHLSPAEIHSAVCCLVDCRELGWS